MNSQHYRDIFVKHNFLLERPIHLMHGSEKIYLQSNDVTLWDHEHTYDIILGSMHKRSLRYFPTFQFWRPYNCPHLWQNCLEFPSTVLWQCWDRHNKTGPIQIRLGILYPNKWPQWPSTSIFYYVEYSKILTPHSLTVGWSLENMGQVLYHISWRNDQCRFSPKP